jgi:hypothetical protein
LLSFGAVLIFYHGAVGNGLVMLVLAGFLAFGPSAKKMEKDAEGTAGHMMEQATAPDEVVSAQMDKRNIDHFI